MALKISRAAKASVSPTPGAAGIIAVARFSHSFAAAGLLATDILEVGQIPATATLVRAHLVGEGLGGTITVDVGVLSGTAEEPDDGRTLGPNLLFDDQGVDDTDNGVTNMRDVLAITPGANHRGIGVTPSAEITSGAGKSLTLVVEYHY